MNINHCLSHKHALYGRCMRLFVYSSKIKSCWYLSSLYDCTWYFYRCNIYLLHIHVMRVWICDGCFISLSIIEGGNWQVTFSLPTHLQLGWRTGIWYHQNDITKNLTCSSFLRRYIRISICVIVRAMRNIKQTHKKLLFIWARIFEMMKF